MAKKNDYDTRTISSSPESLKAFCDELKISVNDIQDITSGCSHVDGEILEIVTSLWNIRIAAKKKDADDFINSILKECRRFEADFCE